LCLYARELIGFDRLIISVSKNPFKQSCAAADVHRRKMAELLSAEINATGDCSEVSGWELSRNQPSYTIDLLRFIRALYPRADTILLVGEDSYRDLPRWKSFEQIVSLCRIAVFRRKAGGDPLHEQELTPGSASIMFFDFDLPVAASDIRERIASGEPVSNLLPSSIRQYITEHHLYQ
jgi:nicotinate-nucleotide adenylyltransferase